MKTRIRYSQVPNTLTFTSKPLIAGTKVVVVNLMGDTNTLTVVENDTSVILHQETGKSLRNLKKRAKQLLKDMGVVFQDEIRQKRTNSEETVNV